jgi:signal transduction histidine kinase
MGSEYAGFLAPLAKRMLELPPGVEFDADLIESRIHPDDRSSVQLAIDRARADEFDASRTYEIEYRIQTNDLRTRWLRMRGRPRRDRFGRPREMTGTMLDITDSKQMQGELEKQRLTLLHLSRVSVLGELSGALAHELKQPLTAIMSNAQAAQRILSHQSIDFEELRGAIGDIIEDDARAGSVISRLRALLKNEEVRREPVDLHALLLTSLDLVQSHLTARKINVIKRFWGADLVVSGDAVQLQQLMLNIFLNACEAMGSSGTPGGTMLLTADRSSERHIHIAVSDSGCGIRHEVLTKLFDPLVTTKPQGMGLGLSISRAIVESHGGKIWAMNNAGRGATLHVMFPLLQPN